MKKTGQIAISAHSFHFIWHHALRWVSDIGYYRIISNTTVSVCRIPSFLTEEIRSESSESDDGKWTENSRNNRKLTESIRSDLIVGSSRILIRSDRIRPSYIHLGAWSWSIQPKNILLYIWSQVSKKLASAFYFLSKRIYFQFVYLLQSVNSR